MRTPTTLRVRNNGTVAIAGTLPGNESGVMQAYNPLVRFNVNASGITSTGLWRRDNAWVDVEVMWHITGVYDVGALQFWLPVHVAQMGFNCGQQLGGCLMVQQGVGRYNAKVFVEGGTTDIAYVDASWYTWENRVTHNMPWAWALQDSGVCTLRYRGVYTEPGTPTP